MQRGAQGNRADLVPGATLANEWSYVVVMAVQLNADIDDVQTLHLYFDDGRIVRNHYRTEGFIDAGFAIPSAAR